MSMTFYYAPMSTASITEVVLGELGLSPARVKLDIAAGETQTAAFKAINPNGEVPTLVDGETVIWESAAITIYLGERYGVEKGLYPKLGPARGDAMKWIVWSNVKLAAAAGRLSVHSSDESVGAAEEGSAAYIAPSKRDAAAAAKARQDIDRLLGILEGGLAGREFLLDAYSLVDTHLHGFVWWLEMMGTPLPPAVAAWFERCNARPAIAASQP